MSLLGLRFRAIASHLQLLDYQHQDLAFEKVSNLVATQLTNRWERAIAHRQDPEDPYTVWELLYLDAVINLEDCQGKFTRVGVSLVTEENKAYRVLKQAQKPAFNKVRKSLKIYRYWVFCVEPKYFPDCGEWVDILYSEIDKPNREGSSRLIIL
ncbi:hypothetical protein [Myxosarcina sp. GI1]|uniref:hypothetical protein n=1 Tax=Myxosarcina sp. GI1 TaxID=1541065 RepID=UPI000561AEEF|nr:hypothetical protein [Myxosarcina sp. GI1]